jgi:predicted lipid-binding transport protein (Tim44 family)
MPFLLLLIGAVLLIATVRNTQGDLGIALAADVPPFLKWAVALLAVGAIGWVPKMQPISRMLLALVIVVLVLKNYQQLFAGFTSLSKTTPQASTAATTPAQAYAANPASPQVTEGQITGTSQQTNVNAFAGPVVTSPFGVFDPAAFLSAFEQGVGGFGGVA